jgi:hypothetical protein
VLKSSFIRTLTKAELSIIAKIMLKKRRAPNQSTGTEQDCIDAMERNGAIEKVPCNLTLVGDMYVRSFQYSHYQKKETRIMMKFLISVA